MVQSEKNKQRLRRRYSTRRRTVETEEDAEIGEQQAEEDDEEMGEQQQAEEKDDKEIDQKQQKELEDVGAAQAQQPIVIDSEDEKEDGRMTRLVKRRKLGHDANVNDADRRALRNDQRELYEKIELDDFVDLSTNKQKNDKQNDSDDDDSSKSVDNDNNKLFLHKYHHLRTINNTLFADVAFTREAVLDGQNMNLIAKKMAGKVDQLIQVPRYDTLKFILKLKEKCSSKNEKKSSSSFFNWNTLGNEIGICYNAIPSRVNFLLGALDDRNCSEQLSIQRQRRQRRRKSNDIDDEKEDVPEEEGNNKEKGKNQSLSLVEHNMKLLKKYLKQKVKRVCDQKYNNLKRIIAEQCPTSDNKQKAVEYFQHCGSDVNALQYLINPKSFTQTVENIFHFSFLIKKGEAGIYIEEEEDGDHDTNNIDDELKQIIKAIDNVNDGEEENGSDNTASATGNNNASTSGVYIRSYLGQQNADYPTASQSILSLNMRDWRRLVEAYKIKKGDLPHRKDVHRTRGRN